MTTIIPLSQLSNYTINNITISPEPFIKINFTSTFISFPYVQDITIFSIILFIYFILFILNIYLITCHFQNKIKNKYTELSVKHKLKKQGIYNISTYYENIKKYNGSIYFYNLNLPYLSFFSILSSFFWFIGSLILFQLLTVNYLQNFNLNNFCLSFFIWLFYSFGNSFWLNLFFVRILLQFIYKIYKNDKKNLKIYENRNIIAFFTILFLQSIIIIYGILSSIFMKFNGNGPLNFYNNYTTCYCNRIDKFDYFYLIFIIIHYLFIIFTIICIVIDIIISLKRNCHFINIIQHFGYLLSFILFLSLMIYFHVLLFFYGFQDISIENIPLSLKYIFILMIPIIEIIYFISIHFNTLFYSCCCKTKIIKEFKVYDLQNENLIKSNHQIPKLELKEINKNDEELISPHFTSVVHASPKQQSHVTVTQSSLLSSTRSEHSATSTTANDSFHSVNGVYNNNNTGDNNGANDGSTTPKKRKKSKRKYSINTITLF